MSLLDKYSDLNNFKILSGKNNSYLPKSKKYVLKKKELYKLFLKYLTKDDINNIIEYLELESNDYTFVIEKCYLLIKTSCRINRGIDTSTDYKDLFMERVLLDNCFSAIKLLKKYQESIINIKK
jgi:hypothetical protein